jgi:phosphoglycerate dehydrogenase-like enzyme
MPDGWEIVEVDEPCDGRGDGGAPSQAALDAVRDAEVFIGYGFPEPLFDAAHAGDRASLRWVHSAAAGVGSMLYPRMRESPIVVTNSAGVHAEPMAETVIAMLLHFARGLDLAVRAQARREWDKAPFERADPPVREIAGATIGIIGYGGIGRAVARRALALEMNVLTLKRTPEDVPDGIELLMGDDALPELLAFSDYVVVAVPETGETRGMIGPAEIDRLRPGAVFINVARGGVVDEDALAAALDAGRIRGAALDVFDLEPLPPESPLWTTPNLLIMPHVSPASTGFWPRQTDLIVENIERYSGGQPLINEVNKSAGY